MPGIEGSDSAKKVEAEQWGLNKRDIQKCPARSKIIEEKPIEELYMPENPEIKNCCSYSQNKAVHNECLGLA